MPNGRPRPNCGTCYGRGERPEGGDCWCLWKKETLAVDFDGVIHAYSDGWNGGACYDIPMEGCADALVSLAEGREDDQLPVRDDHAPVREWLATHLPESLHGIEVTNVKPKATYYLDDRAVRFIDWGTALADIKRLEHDRSLPRWKPVEDLAE